MRIQHYSAVAIAGSEHWQGHANYTYFWPCMPANSSSTVWDLTFCLVPIVLLF